MSVNTLIEARHLPELKAFGQILQGYLARWEAARTVEERLTVEAQGVAVFEDLLKLAEKIDEVSPAQHPSSQDFAKRFAREGNLGAINAAKLSTIVRKYLDYFNNQNIAILELIGSLKRAKQKKAVLNLWDRSESKWLLAESFLNYDNLDTSFTAGQQAAVRVIQGALTLPIESSVKILPRKVLISSTSNGFPGNSDTDIQTNNSNPVFMLDGKPDTWFEYERMDSGPLTLSLVCDFNTESILNGLLIRPVSLLSGIDFQIDDVIFNTSKGAKSLRDLVPDFLPESFWTVRNIGNDIFWETVFMPVVCKSLVIKLKQETEHSVKVSTSDRREVSRTRYAIGIKNLEFYQHRYKSSGGINSVSHNVPAGLYGLATSVEIFPKTNKLYDVDFRVSTDAGADWSDDILSFPQAKSTSVALDGTPGSIIWRLTLERTNPAFENATSFTDEEIFHELRVSLSAVSKLVSPMRAQLREKPFNKEVYVLQPKVGRMTDSNRKAVLLGIASGGTQTFNLPDSLLNLGLDYENLKVYVNNNIWQRVDNLTDLELPVSSLYDGKYMLSEAQDQILLPNYLAGGSTVKYSFNEERMLFSERSDGYYYKMPRLFDPDKNNIVITNLPSDAALKRVTLQEGLKVHDLGFKNLHGASGSVPALTVLIPNQDPLDPLTQYGQATTASSADLEAAGSTAGKKNAYHIDTAR